MLQGLFAGDPLGNVLAHQLPYEVLRCAGVVVLMVAMGAMLIKGKQKQTRKIIKKPNKTNDTMKIAIDKKSKTAIFFPVQPLRVGIGRFKVF